MISETIIKSDEIEKAVNFMMNQHLDNIVLATIPAGAIVSMRDGDLVIVTETPTPCALHFGELTQEQKDQSGAARQ